jgi:hypothetical protein
MKIAKRFGCVKLRQFSPYHWLDTLRQLNGVKQRNRFSGKEEFWATRSECLDHTAPR